VTDIRLQPVDSQDNPGLAGQELPQPPVIAQGNGEQLVVAVQQVGHGPLGNADAAAQQGGMNLGHAAMLGVAQGACEGDDVQAELVAGEGEAALALGPVGAQVTAAASAMAAADRQVQPGAAGQGDEGAVVGVIQPHALAASGAVLA
jgi:hypothetical protein